MEQKETPTKLDAGQVARIAKVRMAFKELSSEIRDLCPDTAARQNVFDALPKLEDRCVLTIKSKPTL